MRLQPAWAGPDSSLLCFRLTGARYYTFTLADLKHRGIQLDAMNLELVSNINFAGADAGLITYVDYADNPGGVPGSSVGGTTAVLDAGAGRNEQVQSGVSIYLVVWGWRWVRTWARHGGRRRHDGHHSAWPRSTCWSLYFVMYIIVGARNKVNVIRYI